MDDRKNLFEDQNSIYARQKWQYKWLLRNDEYFDVDGG
jgi:hypothetical protein